MAENRQGNGQLEKRGEKRKKRIKSESTKRQMSEREREGERRERERRLNFRASTFIESFGFPRETCSTIQPGNALPPKKKTQTAPRFRACTRSFVVFWISWF